MSRIILPDYPLGATIDFDYPSTDAYGQSIAPSSAGTLRIYKGSSSTPRSSLAGITHTLTHRSTGVNHITIDTTDDTDAGFYQGESEYSIVLEGIVIHGRSLNLPAVTARRHSRPTGPRVKTMHSRMPSSDGGRAHSSTRSKRSPRTTARRSS
jgi:hypothetical protein